MFTPIISEEMWEVSVYEGRTVSHFQSLDDALDDVRRWRTAHDNGFYAANPNPKLRHIEYLDISNFV